MDGWILLFAFKMFLSQRPNFVEFGIEYDDILLFYIDSFSGSQGKETNFHKTKPRYEMIAS